MSIHLVFNDIVYDVNTGNTNYVQNYLQLLLFLHDYRLNFYLPFFMRSFLRHEKDSD